MTVPEATPEVINPDDTSTDAEHGQLYSIGDAVIELQRQFPDVTHSSLRFLEREGFLQPYRTAGGHRKFRASDIERVRTIKEWQAQRLSLDDIRRRLVVMENMPSARQLQDRFLDAGLAGRGDEAFMTILNADEAGFPLVGTFRDVICPVLKRIGDGWADGSVSVAQEHELSELTRDLVAELGARHAMPPRGTLSVVSACVEGELHELGLRMISGLLRQRGIRVHFLGADVPTTFLVDAVRRREPDGVVLSVTIEDNRPAVIDAVKTIRDEIRSDKRPVIFVDRHHQSGNDYEPDFGVIELNRLPIDAVVAAIAELETRV